MTIPQLDYDRAVETIRARTSLQPRVGLVLGSGLGGLADTLTDRIAIPYADIPGFPTSTVHGHHGNLVIGMLEGQVVVAQQGRAHFYEGYALQQITFPIRVMKLLGADTVILTNAAGGLNRSFSVGDLMLINDHINFVGMAGANPLIGPNDERFGTRFPGMSQTYDRELRRLAHQAATESGITLQEGVYACLAGPTFETPAEIRALMILGADAVGMSTAHEVVVARHAGMRVMALSGITNVTITEIDTELDTNHEEVLDAGKILVPKLTTVLKGVLRAL